jgi:hypothetical protein
VSRGQDALAPKPDRDAIVYNGKATITPKMLAAPTPGTRGSMRPTPVRRIHGGINEDFRRRSRMKYRGGVVERGGQ